MNNIVWICLIRYPLNKSRASVHIKPTRVIKTGSYYTEANPDGSIKKSGKEYFASPSLVESGTKEDSIIAYNLLIDTVQDDWDLALQTKKDKFKLNKI